MIAKIKLYSVELDNKEVFRGSFRRYIIWPFQSLEPQPGMTIIIPKSNDIGIGKDVPSFRFYLSNIIVDLRNGPSEDIILIDKRRFYYRLGSLKDMIAKIKATLRDHNWYEIEEGEPFDEEKYI